MKKDTKTLTPLLVVLRQLGDEARRSEFAAAASTPINYLYQLASCKRQSCSALKAKRISDASVLMHEKYGSDVITMEQIATMCPLPGASAS